MELFMWLIDKNDVFDIIQKTYCFHIHILKLSIICCSNRIKIFIPHFSEVNVIFILYFYAQINLF